MVVVIVVEVAMVMGVIFAVVIVVTVVDSGDFVAAPNTTVLTASRCCLERDVVKGIEDGL